MKKHIVHLLLKPLALGLGISLVAVNLAWAADLNYDADTTVSLTSPAINLTIKSGSRATSVTVQTSNLNVTIPTNSSFTITSASRDITTSGYSVQAAVNTTCNSSNLAQVSVNTTTQAETVTFTPTAAACVYTGSGGGGSGGGVTPTPTPTPTPPPSSGGSGTHPNGTLVNDNGTIYLIKDGKRIGFRNEAEYKSHGYNFGQAVAANAQDKALPQAEFVQKALEGTLVLDLADGKTIYMIGQNGTKRGFTSESVFKGLGYNFKDIPKINVSDYPPGPPVGDSALAHPDGALVIDGKTVWWIRGNTRQGFQSEVVFNTYGFKFGNVAKANAADKALLEGALVKFRDGTLVNDGGTYYLISDGKKLMFTSAADLTAKGYKTSSATNASLAAYESGGNVQ